MVDVKDQEYVYRDEVDLAEALDKGGEEGLGNV